MTRCYALITARAGSQGVPHKNIRPLAGYPLLCFSIAAAKLCPAIQRVLISTDSADYAHTASQWGAEAPFLRPGELASHKAPDLGVFVHATRWLQEHNQPLPDYWVHLRPTTPLRDPQVIQGALERLAQHPKATSLRSAHECSESPYKWFIEKNGYYQPLASDLDPTLVDKPRQELPTVYIPNGYVDIVRPEVLLQGPSLQGDRILAYETPVCTEVDTLDDFAYLEYQVQQNSAPLAVLDYLKQRTARA